MGSVASRALNGVDARSPLSPLWGVLVSSVELYPLGGLPLAQPLLFFDIMMAPMVASLAPCRKLFWQILLRGMHIWLLDNGHKHLHPRLTLVGTPAPVLLTLLWPIQPPSASLLRAFAG